MFATNRSRLGKGRSFYTYAMTGTPHIVLLFFHIVHNNRIVNTITTIALQLDKLPTITSGAVVPEIVDPDGAATRTTRARLRGEIPLIPTRRIFDKEVSEEWLEEGRTATYETGVDFDDTSGTRGQHRKEGKIKRRRSKGKSSRDEKRLCVQPGRIGLVEIDDQQGKAKSSHRAIAAITLVSSLGKAVPNTLGHTQAHS